MDLCEERAILRAKRAASGFCTAQLRTDLSTERVIAARRAAVANPDAALVAAAQRGVVLSCITQARRLGLWVHQQHPEFHVAATPGSAGGKPDHIRVHWSRPLVPRREGVLEDPIENVLAIVAECEPYEQALATWESALNTARSSQESAQSLRRTCDSAREREPGCCCRANPSASAYNGQTSIDPAITGELSEEQPYGPVEPSGAGPSSPQ